MSKVYAAKYKDGTHKLFDNWPECQANVKGVPGVRFKGFNSTWEADKWLDTETTSFVDDDNTGTKIYVDGSYMDLVKAASWAFIVVEDDAVIYEESGVVVNDIESRNIVGECYAAMKAIDWAVHNNKNIQLVHDYAGISAWLTGEWEKNKPIAKRYYTHCHKHIDRIKFVNVRGHQSNKWNEYVDNIAGETLRLYNLLKKAGATVSLNDLKQRVKDMEKNEDNI